MKLTEIKPNIYYLKFTSQYDAAMSMIRLQEFYESPYHNIRGKFFTLEEYMDTYAKEFGKFDYDMAWNGYNVPDYIMEKFYDKFNKDLRKREINLLQCVYDYRVNQIHAHKVQASDKFYLIAGSSDEVIMHETAHAFYYLYPEYRKEMRDLINKIPLKVKNCYFKQLRKVGYCEAVLEDELQAYFIDSYHYKKDILFKDSFSVLLRAMSKPMYEVFKKYDKQKIEEGRKTNTRKTKKV